MLACGRGFVVATPETPPALADFLRQRVDTFACHSLAADQPVTSENLAQYAWIYLMVMVAAVWMIVGVSWSALAPLFGALFGTVVVLAYALLRTVVPRWAAVPPAVLLSFSTLHLQNLPHLRDYAKAPFVLALVLILFWMVKRPLPARTFLALMAAYGLLLGIGYGFRTDLLANIPPLAVTVLLFLPGGLTRNLWIKAAGLALAGALFVAAAWMPATFVVQRGGCQWHVVLLGLDDTFTRVLRVTPSFYGWSTSYSDEYTYSSVNAFRERMEGAAPADYCSAVYDAESGAYLLEIFARFPADVLMRAYAAAIRVLDLPFYWWSTIADEPAAQRSTTGFVLTKIAGAARLASVVTVVILGAVSLRIGLFALCVVIYFGGYPSAQFANRHYFHLEFLGWLAMAFVASQIVRSCQSVRRGDRVLSAGVVRRAAAFTAVAAALLLVPVPMVRAYQNRSVRALVDELLAAPRVPLVMPDSNSGRSGAAYLDIRFDLDACPNAAPVALEYVVSNPLFDFTGPLIPMPRGSIPERILVPVFDGFRSLTVDPSLRHCIASVDRLAELRGRPLLPVLTLPRGWVDLPTHQSLAGWWR
jgi:hypothetical protein